MVAEVVTKSAFSLQVTQTNHVQPFYTLTASLWATLVSTGCSVLSGFFSYLQF